MTEIMLRDAGAAHGLRHVILRYFNVAGADPALRTGQSTRGATHLIKVAVETALGRRAKMQVFGTDYPTADGTCIRDYIHVSDLVRAHSDAVAYLRRGGASVTLNCGYGRGFSVLEVIETVKQLFPPGLDRFSECPASGRAQRHWSGSNSARSRASPGRHGGPAAHDPRERHFGSELIERACGPALQITVTSGTGTMNLPPPRRNSACWARISAAKFQVSRST